MKKVLSLVLVFVFAVSAAFAGDARIAGLSLNSWMTTDDNSIISVFPAQIMKYSNQATVELGIKGSSLDNYYFAQLALDKSVLGVVLNKPVSVSSGLLNSLGTYGSWDMADPSVLPSVTNVFGVSYGMCS